MQNISSSSQVFANQVKSISQPKFSNTIAMMITVAGAIFTTLTAFFLAALLAPGIGLGGVIGVSLAAGTLTAIAIFLIFKKAVHQRQHAIAQKASLPRPLKQPSFQQPSVNPVLFQKPAYQAPANQPPVNLPDISSTSSLSRSPLYLAHEKEIEQFKIKLIDSLKNVKDILQENEQVIRNKIDQLELRESNLDSIRFTANKIQEISFNILDLKNKYILKLLENCGKMLNFPLCGPREYEHFHNTITLEIRKNAIIQKNESDQGLEIFDSIFNLNTADKDTIELLQMWKKEVLIADTFFYTQGENLISFSENILKRL